MPGLVPGIHDFLHRGKDVDARHKAGHDDVDAKPALKRRPRCALLERGGCANMAFIACARRDTQ
jgi:hypothetical protein